VRVKKTPTPNSRKTWDQVITPPTNSQPSQFGQYPPSNIIQIFNLI